MAKKNSNNETEIEEKRDCFVLMPISDPEGYAKGHFKKVYDNILKPACKMAGYNAIRADEVAETNLIHLDILQRLLDAPMTLCDLSSRNPNALFELGIRQAFDKPVVLVQEVGTKPIFDIAPIRYVEYRNQRIYDEVVEDQKKIANSIEMTAKDSISGKGVNSIVKLLSLTKSASLIDSGNSSEDQLLQLLRAEISALRQEFREGISDIESELGDIPKIQRRRNSLLESSRLSNLEPFTKQKKYGSPLSEEEIFRKNLDIEEESRKSDTPEDDDIPF